MRAYLTLAFLLLIITPAKSLGGYFDLTIESLLKEQLTDENLRFEIKYDSSNKLQKIFSKETHIEGITLSFFSPVTHSFKALVKFDDKEELEIFGKYDTYFEIPITNRLIKVGEIINYEDIKMHRVRKLSPSNDVIISVQDLIGMQVKKPIAPGQVVKNSDIKKPPVIKENDPVTLLYRSNTMTLKTMGIALMSGAVGDKIKVKNEKTGIVVFGEIIDRNSVNVGNDE